MNRSLPLVLAAALLCGVLASCARQAPDAVPVAAKAAITLKSSAFTDGGNIPAKYTCDGVNISPPLNWSGVPHEAKSLALICTDLDAPSGQWAHWLLWNIPSPARKLLEGFSQKSTLANGAVQGINDFKKTGWGGPCPPSGSHRYRFVIYALDTNLKLPPSTTQTELIAAMQNHVLAQGELTGKYAHAK